MRQHDCPRGKGPFPLIVFAHGSAGHPEKFTKLFSSWAAAGYIVAAPAFPRDEQSCVDCLRSLRRCQQPAW